MATIAEVIAEFDLLKPNSINADTKKKWLAELDYQVASEVIGQTEDEKFSGYNADTDESTELLICDAYKEAYIYWLMSKADFFNAEYTRYNNDIAMFNNKYLDFKAYYIGENKPMTTKIEV